jgi:activating signal cointegrator complex subunit 1
VTSASRPQLKNSLATFRDDVTSPVSFNLPVTAIRPVGTLHLTLAIMSFPRDEGLDRAVTLLEGLKANEILALVRARRREATQGAEAGSDGKPALAMDGKGSGLSNVQDKREADSGIRVTLRGLHAMQEPSRTSVLYAPPTDAEGILQDFSEEIKRAFGDAELLVEGAGGHGPLLLHATIVNTVYVKDLGKGGGRGRGGRHEKLTIDARHMLDRYEDQVWMDDVRLEKLAICKMGAKKIVVDGENDEAYEVVAEIQL